MTVNELIEKPNKFPQGAVIQVTTGELFMERDIRVTAGLEEEGTVLDMEIF